METKPAKAKAVPDIPLDEWYPDIPDGTSVPWRPLSTVAIGLGFAAILGILIVALLPEPHRAAPIAAATATASAAAQTSTAAATSSAPAVDTVVDPCKGLTGALVTSKDGGQDSPQNLVAALEYAFYVKRDVTAVTALYAPNVLAGAAVSGISDFIAKIPQTTTYCVAIRPTGATTVDYDINEIRPTPGYPETVTTYTESMTVTSTAPYLIASLHTRK